MYRPVAVAVATVGSRSKTIPGLRLAHDRVVAHNQAVRICRVPGQFGSATPKAVVGEKMQEEEDQSEKHR